MRRKQFNKIIISLIIAICFGMVPYGTSLPGSIGTIEAEAATETAVKSLTTGKTYSIKGYAKVTSSKTSIATSKKKSSSKYTITAVKKGRTTLKCYNSDGKVVKKIYLIVTNSSSFKYDTTAVTMTVGDTETVTATAQTGCTIKYTSSDKTIAKVSSSGIITAKKAGTVTISAKFYYKDVRIKTLKKTITVEEAEEEKSGSSENSATNQNQITVEGAVFDMSGFPEATSVSEYGSTIGFAVNSAIDPQDVTYIVNGGNAELLYDYTCEGTMHRTTLNEEYEYGYYVPGWNNAIAYIKTSYDSSYDLPYRVTIIPQTKTGTITVSAYYKGKLLRTCTVRVNVTSKYAVKCRSDLEAIKEETWTSGMTALEKLSAIATYISENYPYSYDIFTGYDCIAGARAIVMAARDMGYTAYFYRMAAESSTISGHIWYHHVYELDEYWVSGHVYAVVVIDGQQYRYDVQGY